MPASETGVIHGRFQIVHNDHLKYLLAGKKLADIWSWGLPTRSHVGPARKVTTPKKKAILWHPLTYYDVIV
jgi:nicotinamide-nucleotide adenylyltransferase